MRFTLPGALAAVVALTAFTVATPALAQADNDEGFDKSAEDSIAVGAQLEAEKGDKMPGEKDKKAEPEAAPSDPTDHDPKELPGTAYSFVGLRFRNIIVPKFMVNVFADGGSTINVFTIGPELSYRKDRTEFDFALSYADYSFDPMLFKGHEDDAFSWEEVSSSMKALYLTLDILYDIPVIDDTGRFSVLAGGGVGFGLVAGSMYRYQVQPAVGSADAKINPDDPSSWRYCEQPGAGVAGYCDTENEHYKNKNYEEPSWANGGSKPFIFPWVSLPQVSFRYKPVKEAQVRLDTGFSLTGFFFGLSAGYGL